MVVAALPASSIPSSPAVSNNSAQAPGAGNPAANSAVAGAPAGQPVDSQSQAVPPGAILFAQLLAKQVLVPDPGTLPEPKKAAVSDTSATPDQTAAAVDPATLLLQQAALFITLPSQVPVQTATQSSPAPVSIQSSSLSAEVPLVSSQPLTSAVAPPAATSVNVPALPSAAPVALPSAALVKVPVLASDASVSAPPSVLVPSAVPGVAANEVNIMSNVGSQPVVSNSEQQSVQAASNSASLRQSLAAGPASFAVPDSGLKAQFDKISSLKLVVSQQTTAEPAVVPQSMPSVVQVQAPVSQTDAVQTSSNIPQAVGHSAWGEMLGNRVVWMVSQQHQSVELHLNPPALGPLEVRVSMSDGQANLSFTTQHLPVKEAIESAASRLGEMLGESGISMGSVSVTVGSFTQPNQQSQDNQGQSRLGRSSWVDVAPVADVAAMVPGRASVSGRNGMVDIFA